MKKVNLNVKKTNFIVSLTEKLGSKYPFLSLIKFVFFSFPHIVYNHETNKLKK